MFCEIAVTHFCCQVSLQQEDDDEPKYGDKAQREVECKEQYNGDSDCEGDLNSQVNT